MLERCTVRSCDLRNLQSHKVLSRDILRGRVAMAIADVSRVPATTVADKLLKRKMLEAWATYASHMDEQPPQGRASTPISGNPVWKTFACAKAVGKRTTVTPIAKGRE
ncbi:hypothetical protein EIP86_001907 [Pleurotus ostreatoroseus]|nr:hypothetical protein EIP86_001907 [Pleurotus ostreatoroseus]